MAFDFDHAVTAPFRMQPGLRKWEGNAPQLTPNRPGARHLREKLAVLMTWPERALQQVDGFDATPALDALAAQAAHEHPAAFQIVHGHTWQATWLGWAVTPAGDVRDIGSTLPEVGACLASLPVEWRRAGLLVLAFAEDFAIIDGANATLPWLAVCLPSHWAPQDKIGRHFAQVHAPVADNAVLIKAGEHLMRLACGAQRWERFVWNLTRHPRLNNHPATLDPTPWPAEADADALAALTWFRTEQQTFIPLPERQQAVFTILVDTQPLPEAITTAAQAQALAEAVATMSEAVLDYRDMADARGRLLDWLNARASL